MWRAYMPIIIDRLTDVQNGAYKPDIRYFFVPLKHVRTFVLKNAKHKRNTYFFEPITN